MYYTYLPTNMQVSIANNKNISFLRNTFSPRNCLYLSSHFIIREVYYHQMWLTLIGVYPVKDYVFTIL